MLEGLDEVPWHELHHAYGTAEDVPGLIRALAGSASEAKDALYELFGNIWHQGTVYEATSYAVPFLVELAGEPTITKRDEILGLIGSLAEGSSYLDVHARIDSPIADFWRKEPDFDDDLQKELKDVQRTRLAVWEHRDLFVRLLEDAAPMVRAGAAYVLSQFPEHLTDIGPLIRQAAQNEPRNLARAGMLWCLGELRDASTETISLLEASLGDASDVRVRYAAAFALYRTQGERHPFALALDREMVAATWFAEGFLAGVPWDFGGPDIGRDASSSRYGTACAVNESRNGQALVLRTRLCHSLALRTSLCHSLALRTSLCHSLALRTSLCHSLALRASIGTERARHDGDGPTTHATSGDLFRAFGGEWI